VTQNISPTTSTENRVWHHYDQVGSVMITSHAGGNGIQGRYADAFGNTISSHFTGTWIDSWSASGHNTKEYDLEADLVYMYQRWYDPKSGTFASMAPFPPMREHEYGFASSKPNSNIDPNGMIDWGWTPIAGQFCNRSSVPVQVLINGKYYTVNPGECTGTMHDPDGVVCGDGRFYKIGAFDEVYCTDCGASEDNLWDDPILPPTDDPGARGGGWPD
ncbi:MAG: RHS repeat-associated core domain-containing protein, partial [Candidatus Sumerlaeia bacterium]|nr:RHS repeat-associated core domain-containing protein [Candidatus Sumerlaeia bacterium]